MTHFTFVAAASAALLLPTVASTQTWFENPEAHHQVSANASDTEPSSLLAVFVVDADDEPLTTLDPQ